MSDRLTGKVCIVTGASRGIGKGIALQLGEAGATVYITGRTLVSGNSGGMGGSLQETAQEIERRGGKCVPVQCDHSKDEDIKRLFEKVDKEQNGRLDILVNNAFSAVNVLVENLSVPFWEQPMDMWDNVNEVGLRSHYIATNYAAKLMVPARRGLIVNISSPGGLRYMINVPYGIGKDACDRMAVDCAVELHKHNVTFISLWPGLVRTEILTKRDLKATNENASRMWKYAETTEFAGKAIVNLGADPFLLQKSGRIHITMDLAEEYGFCDVDGNNPVNYRQLKGLLRLGGYSWLATFTPSFIKIPFWLMAAATHKFKHSSDTFYGVKLDM